MSPSVPVVICVLASFREPEDSRNVKSFVLRVLTSIHGALSYANLKPPPLLVELLILLVYSVVICRRIVGGAGIVIVHQVGPTWRGCRRKLHVVGYKVSLKLIMIIGMDEIDQRLTQQFVLRNSNSFEIQTRISNFQV